MDCSDRETVDLCSETACINSTITFKEASRKPHSPNHGMFKVSRIIFDRDTARIEKAAKRTLNFAHDAISRLQEERCAPRCVNCRTAVSSPCWCCVECAGE